MTDKEEAKKHLLDVINATKGKIPSGSASSSPAGKNRTSVKKKVVSKQRIHVEKVKTQSLGVALIVEENKRIALLLQNMLKTIRFDSVIALNGADAIQALKKTKVKIAYIGKDLPDIGGFNLCTKIRVEENGKDIPIIITSESTDPSMKDQAIMVDANDHLQTPISMAALKSSVVDNLLKKKDD